MPRQPRLEARGMLHHIIERGIEGTNSRSKEIRETLRSVGLISAVVLSHGGGRDGLSGTDFGGISGSSFGKPSWNRKVSVSSFRKNVIYRKTRR